MYLALSYIAVVLSLVFAVALLDQYLSNRRNYVLIWAVGLFVALIANGLWFIQEAFPLNEGVFRLWYFSGAMAGPAILGTGMVYFIAPRHIANAIAGFVVVTLLAGLSITLAAGLETPGDCVAEFGGMLTGLECLSGGDALTGSGLFPPAVFILAILLNVYALITLLAGAGWALGAVVMRGIGLPGSDPNEGRAPDGSRSLVAKNDMVTLVKALPRQLGPAARAIWGHREFWKGDRLTLRGAGALLIAVGAVIAGLGGLLDAFDLPGIHLWLVFLGLIFIYAGLVTIRDAFEVAPLTAARQAVDTVKTWERPSWLGKKPRSS